METYLTVGHEKNYISCMSDIILGAIPDNAIDLTHTFRLFIPL